MRHTFADCILDTETLTLTRSGVAVAVEPQVFDLLRLLVENTGRVVTRDEIVEAVWGGRIVSESAISARIAAARRAVGCDGKTQSVIRTVARRGLQMVAEVSAESAQVEAPRGKAEDQRIRYTHDPEGRSIAFALTGAGTPLFRLGYNTTHLGAEWSDPYERETFERLAAHHRLLRYDPVGYGMSDRALSPVDFATMADNALRVADAAGFDRFAAYSESGGVHTLLNLAARHPDRLSRIIIVGGYAEGRTRRDAAAPRTFHTLVAEGWGVAASPFPGAFLYPYFPEAPPEILLSMSRNVQQAASKEALLAMRDAIDAVSSADLLSRVRCPALVIHARNDGVHPLSEALKLAAGIPDAQLVVHDSANHLPLPTDRHYDAYIEAMLTFLAE